MREGIGGNYRGYGRRKQQHCESCPSIYPYTLSHTLLTHNKYALNTLRIQSAYIKRLLQYVLNTLRIDMDTKRIQNAPIWGFVSFRMNKQQVSERLRALATGDEHRSKTARLRDVYADVEFALKAGVSRATVLKELEAAGLKMSMASFTSTLQRIRAAMKSQQKGNAVPAQSSNKAITEIEENNISENRSDPARITAIMRSTPDLDALAKAGKLAIKEMKK
jgi:hypothetical protein